MPGDFVNIWVPAISVGKSWFVSSCLAAKICIAGVDSRYAFWHMFETLNISVDIILAEDCKILVFVRSIKPL